MPAVRFFESLDLGLLANSSRERWFAEKLKRDDVSINVNDMKTNPRFWILASELGPHIHAQTHGHP
jgi:hypothetical protein